MNLLKMSGPQIRLFLRFEYFRPIASKQLCKTFVKDSHICSYVEVSKTLFYLNICHLHTIHRTAFQFFIFGFYKQD